MMSKMNVAFKTRKLLWRLCSAVLLVTLAVGPSGLWHGAIAAQGSFGPIVVDSVQNDLSPALRGIEPVPPKEAAIREIPLGPLPNRDKAATNQPVAPDPGLQQAPGGSLMPAPIANFEGVNNINGVYPPDTQGDVGPNHYVQWVNLSFAIYNKTGTLLYGPANGSTLWSGFGGPCETTNDGDPITLYDPLADRWLMSQFALPSYPNGPFYQCVAVSTTADPLGTWYRYQFTWPGNKMNDYPKFGVWPDGYYMTVNQFASGTGAWAGAGVAVLERSKLLSGLPATMQYFDLNSVDSNFGGMLPSDLDGTPPPVGAPNYFAEVDDSSWIGPSDAMRLWRFHVDWTTPANTTFGLSGLPNAILPVAGFTPLCMGTRSCVPQPGTAQGIDAIGDRLMYRLAYRNFGTHQSLVVNHTVDAGSGRAGVSWYEVRDPGGTPTIYQQGTYAGDSPDSEHRWMGSIAMDGTGNIALGYSVSSGTVYPSIRYVGRLVGDPMGTLPQGETSLMVGSGSQTGSGARWGDYSMMAVDPSDDCTFWYTQEYIQTTGVASWRTRIGSFKFPSCTSGPTGTLDGTVTASSGGAPIAGARVDIGASTTYANGSGYYSVTLPIGSYIITTSAYGFSPVTVGGVAVIADTTTTQDFALDSRSLVNEAGTVTDGSGHGWPLYASLDITATSYSTKIFTDPVTGHYSIDLYQGESYTFLVEAVSPGYTTSSRGVTPPPGGSTEDFTLLVDGTCAAPGFEPGVPNVLLTENFDAASPPALPAGWAQVDVSGTSGAWATNAGTVHPSTIPAHSLPNLAYFNSYSTFNVEQTRLQRTAGLDLSGVSNASVSYWMYHDTGYSSDDRLQVQVSTNGGTSWTDVGAPVSRYDGSTGWAQEVVDLSSYTGPGNTDVRVGFLGISEYGNDVHIDDMAVQEMNCSPVGGGLMVGNVYDTNTSDALTGATVASVSAPADTTTTFSTPLDTALDDGFYILFSSLTGARNFTATMGGGYGVDTRTPTILTNSTVRQDFQVPAGMLAPTPTSFDVTLQAGDSTTRTLTLNNTGGLLATFDIYEVDAPLSAPQPVGPFAEPHRHLGPKRLADRNASGLSVYEPPTAPEIASAGTVINTWPSSLTYPWGVGFDLVADDLWLGNASIGGGDDLNYRFLRNGTNTGDTIDTGPWVAVFAADMTFNPFTGMLWQVNVGGDNCIYEMDPVAETSTGDKICPAFGTSQRGLGYDPLTDTFYSGSWNDGIINHFDSDGTILDSKDVGLSISGLAFNAGTGHLFVVTNANAGFDVYVLDVSDDYNLVGGFDITGLGNYEQAGLEISCDGHLWAVNQITNSVIEADSDETGVCDWQDIPWLSESPTSGSVGGAGSQAVVLTFDAAGLSAGVYPAFLRIIDDTPYALAPIPVTLTVLPPNKIFLPLVLRNYGTGGGLGTPTLLNPAEGATLAKYLFDWTDVPDATGYRFQMSTSTSFSPLAVDAAVGTSEYDYTSTLDGAYYWRVYATGPGGSGPYSPYRSLTLASYNGDDDGDSLRNGWELHGYDYGSNGTIDVDLPAMGANYRHKDIFVEMDYMYRASAANGLAPNATVMNTIVTAFDNFPMSNPDGVPGVDIHLELDDLVPYDSNLQPYATEFATLKAAWFPASRQATHHYMIWADRYEGGTSSGVSMGIPASDFLVTLGGWNADAGGTDYQKIGTFIHELGHNLNLTHGGSDHVNYKPNYISIMNYTWQTLGLYHNSTWYNWEYQPFALPALNEASLSEPAGLGSAAAAGYGTVYVCAGSQYLVSNAAGPIDWSCDGDVVDTGVSRDENFTGTVETLAATSNNYSQILFNGGTIGSGLAPDALREFAQRLSDTLVPVTDELTWEMQQKIDAMFHRSPTAPSLPMDDNR